MRGVRSFSFRGGVSHRRRQPQARVFVILYEGDVSRLDEPAAADGKLSLERLNRFRLAASCRIGRILPDHQTLVLSISVSRAMADSIPNPPEVEELERTAAWRLRLVDADPSDTASGAAAVLLERLAGDLRRNDYETAWTELRSIGNWLSESDAISDYADLGAAYRAAIGV